MTSFERSTAWILLAPTLVNYSCFVGQFPSLSRPVAGGCRIFEWMGAFRPGTVFWVRKGNHLQSGPRAIRRQIEEWLFRGKGDGVLHLILWGLRPIWYQKRYFLIISYFFVGEGRHICCHLQCKATFDHSNFVLEIHQEKKSPTTQTKEEIANKLGKWENGTGTRISPPKDI